MVIKFAQGDYNSENLEKIAQQGGIKVEDTYIMPDGKVVYLRGEDCAMEKFVTLEQAKEIAERVVEKSVQKTSKEGFEKSDLEMGIAKRFPIYDLAKRIEEINRSDEVDLIPFEKLERLVQEYGYEEAMNFLQQMYPDGVKFTIYSNESMRAWERMREMEEQYRIDIDKLSVQFRNKNIK